MRAQAASILSIGALIGCSPQDQLSDRLFADAVDRVERGECSALENHGRLALEAGFLELSDRIRAIDINPQCEAYSQSSADFATVYETLTTVVGATNETVWSLLWFEGLFDPAPRRARAHYQDLSPACRRFTAEALGRWPELIEVYLSEPDQRVIPAQRAASDQLASCVEGYRGAALAHRTHGEDDWADYWLSMGANLPAGAGEPLIRQALIEDPDGPYVEHYTRALEAALSERIDLADFGAIARLAADASIAQSLEPGYGAVGLLAAIDIARAAGFDIHPTWRTIERDAEMSDFYLGSLIGAWVRGGGLDGDDIPGPFAVLATQCAPGSGVYFFGFDSSPLDRDAEVFSRSGCQRAFNQIGAATGFADAAAALIEEQLVDALRSQRLDTNLVEALADYTRDDIASFTVYAPAGYAPAGRHSVDLYGCARPGPLLQPYWDAAQPGPDSVLCRRLAEAAPAWHDYDALSAALPFDGCDAEALAGSDAGLLRPVRYAAQTGDRSAFACFAEAAALSADLEASIPARTSLLEPVYAGVRLGLLDVDHWRLAGGAHAYSRRHIEL